MIAARPNAIPQYKKTHGASEPRDAAMRFKIPHERYQFGMKRSKDVCIPKPLLAMLGQRNPLDQSLPSMKTPFELRPSLDKLGGIAGFYGSSTQNGIPLRAQTGLGKDNLQPRSPLVNGNF